jgi:uncharacterized protein (TIGR03083 family)
MSLDHLALLADDLAAFVDAVATGPATAEIAGCPGWTLPDLGVHLGSVHRWAREAIVTGALPQIDPSSDPAPTDLATIAAWVRIGADRLLLALHELDPEQPTWHPFPVEPKVAGIWRRRQAQEASVHRWDAQRAIGRSPSIDAAVAEDGIDEYWTVMLPRMCIRESRRTPASVLAVELTDTGCRWVIDGSGGLPVLSTGGDDPSATLRGEAQHVLLRLWGRPIPDGSVHVSGDAATATGWLAMGGA